MSTTRDTFLRRANIIAQSEPDTVDGYSPEEILRLAQAIDVCPFDKLLPENLTPDEREHAAYWGDLAAETLERLADEGYPRK